MTQQKDERDFSQVTTVELCTLLRRLDRMYMTINAKKRRIEFQMSAIERELERRTAFAATRLEAAGKPSPTAGTSPGFAAPKGAR